MVSSDFRQLPGRFGEIGRFCECERPDLSDWPTKVTAGNLRPRRPDSLPARGRRATRAEPGLLCDRPAMRECFAKRSEKVVDRIYLFRKGKDLAAGVGHQPLAFQLLAAVDVEVCPVAVLAARRDALCQPSVGQFLQR